MENKKLEILVIEDNPKHLASAQTEIGKRIKHGANVNVDYAKNLEKSGLLLSKNMYDGVISDIFFPYDNKTNSDTDSFPTGWESGTKNECYELLKEYNFPGGPVNERQRKIIEASDQWIQGYEMHPSGVIIAKRCIEKNIPLVFCTDTNHHGYSTEPIHQFSIKNNIVLVDSSSDLGVSSETKDFSKAYTELLKEVYCTSGEFKSEIEREDVFRMVNFGKPESYTEDFKRFITDYSL